MRATGTAILPLHGGHVPRRIYATMVRLASAIVEYIVEVKGPQALVMGLADPIWFQAFNNVIGMDWDSSGSTTVLTAVLREVAEAKPWLGFVVLGGKGRAMRRLPEEAAAVERVGADPGEVVKFSRLAARVDSAYVQDGYELYHHAVIVAEGGVKVAVQQGMNTAAGLARRYHFAGANLDNPHSGVAGVRSPVLLNAAGEDARSARRVYLEIIAAGPRRFEKWLWEAYRKARGQRSILDYMGEGGAGSKVRGAPRQRGYIYAPVKPSRRLIKSIEEVYKFNPSNDVELALAPGLGPVTLRALALIADLVYSTPTPTTDPVTHPLDPYLYAYAVGGKDGVPRRFDFETALKAARLLEDAIENARLGSREALKALERLRRFLRGVVNDGDPDTARERHALCRH